MFDNSSKLDPVYIAEQFTKNWDQYAFDAYSHYKQFGRGAIVLDFAREHMIDSNMRPRVSFIERDVLSDPKYGFAEHNGELIGLVDTYDPRGSLVMAIRTGPESLYAVLIVAEGTMPTPEKVFKRRGN